MNITDIKEPIVKIISDHDMRAIRREAERLNLEGWITVGEQSKFNRVWTQVMVKDARVPAKKKPAEVEK